MRKKSRKSFTYIFHCFLINYLKKTSTVLNILTPDYSARIYDCFVEEDDLNISKIFRRIFIINQYQKRRQMIKFFNRWKDRKDSLNDNTVMKSSLNKFYNQSYNKVTSITKRSISTSRNRIPNSSNEVNKKKGSFSSMTHEVFI